MRIVETHSHLGGEEFLFVHYPKLLDEIREVVSGVSVGEGTLAADSTRFSEINLSTAFKSKLKANGWEKRRLSHWSASDPDLTRSVVFFPLERQKRILELRGFTPTMTHREVNFVKDRIALECRFTSPIVASNDIFVQFPIFYRADLIDVGIEILPMKEPAEETSSDVSGYERTLLNVLHQGRNVPGTPLLLIGIAP